MLNHMTRTLTRLIIATVFVFAMSLAALAQRPSPTPVNPAILPPGQPTTPPTAPPGVATPTPTVEPTPIRPAVQEPTFPNIKPMPVPPLPNLTRVGVQSSNVLTMSLNDAIKKALQNNNDIEVSRDDVRFSETQLRGLYGVFDPVFNFTPQVIHNVSPQPSVTAGGGVTGTTSTTIFNFSPSISRQFSKGGGFYTATFSNSRQSSSSLTNRLISFYSSNLSLQFTQPL